MSPSSGDLFSFSGGNLYLFLCGEVTTHLISSKCLVPVCTCVSVRIACASHCLTVGAQLAGVTGPEADELKLCNFCSPVVRRNVSSMDVALF